MHDTPNLSPAAAELRRAAEARLREQHPEGGPHRTDADAQRLVHELQVHQIELEMQNEELQQARDTMETELEKYSDLYDFAPVGYLTLDHDGTILEANLAAATLLGKERARLLKRRLGLLLTPAALPDFDAFLKKVFASKDRASCELTFRKEGNHPLEVRLEAALAASGRECRAALMDLTERKRAEADRLVLSKLESTGILAGGIAHDFNNLLTSILLNLDLAQTLIPPRVELSRCLEEAKRGALLARGLSQQLITFAKGGAPVRKLTSLSGVIRDAVRPALGGSRVGCKFSLPEDLWPVELDEGQFGQVIRNIVLNAREAMPQGGMISIRAENVVLAAQEHPSLPPGHYVRITIADRGSGIADEVLPKIFDPYFSTKQRGDQRGMYTAPTAIRGLMRFGEAWPNRHDLSSLRLMGSVGEPINPEAWRWYYDVIGKGRCPIMDTWWQTETGMFMISPMPSMGLKPGSATRPFPGVECDVVDESGKSVGVGEEGYLVIKKPWPAMLRTIYKDPNRYVSQYWEKFPGVYFTGDSARKDEDGYFWIIGRVDDVIKVSGYRLGTAEIESALVSHPAVAEAAAIGLPHEIKGNAIHAYVILRAGQEVTETLTEELKAHVAHEMGPIAKPEKITIVNQLPKTRSGKIMRRVLKSRAQGLPDGDLSTLEE